MTTLREAAQQALETLKMMRDQYEEYACPACDHADAAIYALKEALVEDAMQKFTDVNQELEAALAEPVQELPEFPSHDDKVHAGAVYWYVGTDGKYYSSNEVKLFMDAKTKSLHYEPPKWVLDNFDLIPLYTAPPK